jgi:hypothetical protein
MLIRELLMATPALSDDDVDKCLFLETKQSNIKLP